MQEEELSHEAAVARQETQQARAALQAEAEMVAKLEEEVIAATTTRQHLTAKCVEKDEEVRHRTTSSDRHFPNKEVTLKSF